MSNSLPKTEKLSAISVLLLCALFITTIATSPENNEYTIEDRFDYAANQEDLSVAETDMFMDNEPSIIDAAPMPNTPDAPSEMVESCEEFGSSDCFANNDCAEDARCENVGSDEAPLACCISGERGSLQTGDSCDTATGQQECASSLCISRDGDDTAYCSGECQSDADCPETMPSCISVAFSDSDSMWCFPASN
jgi:hypothetical protein